jgi:hypothetical protein
MLSVGDYLVHAICAQGLFIVHAVKGNDIVMLQTSLGCLAQKY